MAGTRPLVIWGAIAGEYPDKLDRTWARMHDGTRWTDFVELGRRTQRPRVWGSADGTAIARVSDGFTRFDGSSWSTPTPMALADALAMDGSGNALSIESSGSNVFYYPSLAATADGPAVVAWNQSGSPPEQIWASRFY